MRTIGAALLDDAKFVALESERVVLIGLSSDQLRGQLPRPAPVHYLVQRGNQKLAHFIHRLRRRYGPSVRETAKQNAQTVEVVGMPVRYINDPQVAVMERNPIRESLGLSHRRQCTTSTASCSPKIKVDAIGSKPSASPKGFGRSPTIAFPGAVKTLTASVFDVMGAVMCVVSLSSYGAPFYA
jgi:hypothetical protein